MALRRIYNPPNPWQLEHTVLNEHISKRPLEFFVDNTKSILNRNESPDLPFRWSLNPYRGCSHACAYCYARPTHEYLDWSAGSDFEDRIVVKKSAPKLLADAFKKRSWTRETVLFSGNTDCYQSAERIFKITRSCLEVCLKFQNPVHIITKSPLIERDIDILMSLHTVTDTSITLSIPFYKDSDARAIEPGVAPPSRRFETMRKLSSAGLRVGINVAPIIPGLSDDQMPSILDTAKVCGAQYAGFTIVRLPGSVQDVFFERVKRMLPSRVAKIESLIRDVRSGHFTDHRFGHRMKGSGPYADILDTLFVKQCRRIGLQPRVPYLSKRHLKSGRSSNGQLKLFDEPD